MSGLAEADQKGKHSVTLFPGTQLPPDSGPFVSRSKWVKNSDKDSSFSSFGDGIEQSCKPSSTPNRPRLVFSLRFTLSPTDAGISASSQASDLALVVAKKLV